MDISTYRGKYHHRVASNVPNIKKGKNLLFDLEHIKILFLKNNLPTKDIEKEIIKVVTKGF